MVQRWLTLVLDFVGATLAVFVVSLAVKLRSTVSPGFTGVALVNLISFIDSLKNLILVWTMLETSIGAISRIKNFEAETKSENLPGESNIPPKSWPTRGEVEIQGISASYK
jgi:ATP-binding cassette subfamily C (CFTR/MRP) protein 1